MAKTIYKYKIENWAHGDGVAMMPKSSIILSIQLQDTDPTVWAIAESEDELIEKRFKFLATGEVVKDAANLLHRATIQYKVFVLHVFEVLN